MTIKLTWTSVNTRNVCHLLNAVEACTVTEFKEAALEYICLNLETLLENRYAALLLFIVSLFFRSIDGR